MLESLAQKNGRATYQAVSRRLSTAATCSIPCKVMWDLLRTMWHWGRLYLSTSVSPVNSHFTNCFALTYGPGLVQ
jgi:hypothetical protein